MLKPHAFFSHGCSARGGIPLFLLLASWVKLIHSTVIASHKTAMIVLYFIQCMIWNFCTDLLETFHESTERGKRVPMTDVCLNMRCRHIKEAIFPTIHLWMAKLWLWFVVGMFAPSNLSPMQGFGDGSSARCLPEFSQHSGWFFKNCVLCA